MHFADSLQHVSFSDCDGKDRMLRERPLCALPLGRAGFHLESVSTLLVGSLDGGR